MNGVVNVLKPPGMTSHDVVAIMRRLTGIKRIGHTGTLDPMVAGVLPVCIGRATKIADYLMNQGKGYTAEITFGYATDTQDVWGEKISESSVIPTVQEVKEAVESLEGPLVQVPPAHSALKIGGRKAIDMVRGGQTIDMESKRRTIQIHRIVYIGGNAERHLFKLECSKGTYVRAICKDIGEALQSAAHMSFLVRHRSGPFKIDDALTIESLREMSKEEIERNLVPMEDALGYPKVHIPDELKSKVLNGVKLPLGQMDASSDGAGHVSIMSQAGEFIGIASPDSATGRIYMDKLLHVGVSE